MLRTLFGFFAFWIILFVSLILTIPYGVMVLFGWQKARNAFTDTAVRSWGRLILFFGGVKLNIIGSDKLPNHRRLVYISNHSGMLDIPSLLAAVSYGVGFIAKKQLLYVPILNFWMMVIHCIFLDRRDIHDAAKAIAKGAENVSKGYPMAIFPEGTRSKGRGLGTFKKGSLKLALLSDATIIPVTIKGTYELFEKQKRSIPGPVTLQFHEPVEVKGLSEEEKKNLMNKIREVIEKGLE